MSGPKLEVSSNWKKLQEKLKLEQKSKPETNGLKRKRGPEKSGSNSIHIHSSSRKTTTTTTTNEFKKAKLDPRVKRNMGGSLSTTTTTDSSKQSKLINDHDIAPEDISAAYGTSRTLSSQRKSHADDVVNGGLHPTNKIGKYVALDCEMVGTGPPPHLDNVLARASLVNFHGEQIYDSYVQPPPKVRVEDYRTYVSGIKPGHLKAAYARPFAEVQKDVAKVLDGRILVGHALRNDLSALMLSHPKRDLRDTSRHPKFRIESKGKPPALRNLAKSELGIDIQTGEHSSIEDARATMLLFAKEKKGFEEENRKHFGTKKVVAVKEKKGPGREETPSAQDSEDDEDDAEGEDDEDLDMLTGEDTEGIVDDLHATARDSQPKAKKRKKKKRTKRK